MAVSLVEALADKNTKKAVIADSVQVIELEVADKGGLRGAAIKTGFATVKKIKPGILEAAVSQLLPEFAPAVDPFYARAREAGDVRGWFTKNADEIADALLAITDAKAERASNRVMKKVYSSLRGQAKLHTAAAMPRVADLIQRHVG
ncbi:MAG: hypothetical protein H6737_26850 [Alphaproteobacteria bacterium]|nr:hypothetical protein [Alphaproteobacteria bacterium]